MIEISTPRDYHHFSQLQPPLLVGPRGWSASPHFFSCPYAYPFGLSSPWVDGFRLLLMMFPLPIQRLLSVSLRASTRSATHFSTPMLQTAGYTVCHKRKDFNWPQSISLLCFSLRGCLVKTRMLFPIVSTALSWVYPSLPSSSYGQIGLHPTASPLFWLVPTTTWLVSILLLHHSDYDHGPSRLASGRMVSHTLLLLFECLANPERPFGPPTTWIMPGLATPC